jgi:hypothetical protein
VRVSVMLVSCGNPVQPAAEADEYAGGAEGVQDAVQQPRWVQKFERHAATS